jgi:hypothetical protein
MPSYQIMIGGYGGEVAWSKLTQEQYEFWNEKEKSMLEKHVIGSSVFDDSDDEDNNNMMNNIPDYAILRKDDEEWYDLEDIDKEYYCALNYAWLNVIEIDKDGKHIGDVLTYNNLKEEANSSNLGMIVYNESEGLTEQYVMQVYSAEKGTFFIGNIDLSDNEVFDITKLKIYVSEALNEQDDRIDTIEYDGKEIDNEGADTRDKGIDIYIFET